MSDVNTQMKVRRIERRQILDRRLVIAALAIAIVLGGSAVWLARVQIALSRKGEAQQAWGVALLRADDEQLWKARKTLRAYVEQVKRQRDALKDMTGVDGYLIRTSTKCLALYVYATTVLVPGAADECPPKTVKPEDKDKYYADVDASRRLVKSFQENVMLLDQQELLSEPLRRRFLRDSTVEFLTNVWLPVERGLNHVVEKDADARDKGAQALRDWYAERVKKIRDEGRGDAVPETSDY